MTMLPGFAPTVWLGDGIDGMGALEPGSVDLVLSDLPSGETAAEFDRPVCLPAFWSACWRALKPSGQAVLMASSIRFASQLIGSQPRCFRYDLVWEKSLAVGFLNSHHRHLRAHEFLLVFFRYRGTYNAQMVEGFEPINSNARPGQQRATLKITENYNRRHDQSATRGTSRAGATDRFPRSVVHFGSVPTAKKRQHPQQKPDDLLRMLVRQYSCAGDLVVDPFAGSGSTGVAALAEGRRFRGWDSSPRFGVKKV